MGKNSSRLLSFILGLRWVALLVGSLALHYLSPFASENSLAAFFLKEAIFSLILLATIQGIFSFLQMMMKDHTGIAVGVIAADILFGAFLSYSFGASFFLLSALVPISEAFLFFDSGGMLVAVIDLLLVVPLMIQNFLTSSQQSGAVALFLGEFLLGGLIFSLFYITRKSEFDLEKIKKIEVEEKEKYDKELGHTQTSLESLYREHIATQKKLEDVKASKESSLVERQMQWEEEAKKAREQEEKANRKSDELLRDREQLDKELENLNFLVETTSQIYSSLRLEETFVAIVQVLEKILESQTCLIFLLEKEENKTILYPEVASTPYVDYFRNYPVELGEGVIGWVAKEQQTILVENGYLFTVEGQELKTVVDSEKSAIVAPLLQSDGSLLGVIYLGQVDPKSYSWQDVNVLQRFLPHIQTAIANAKEYHEAVAQGLLEPLTGLPNRIYFEERLSEELKRSFRYKLQFSLAFLKIDSFENLSARCEESSIRKIVGEMKELLRGYLRDADILTGVGEGEFGILFAQTDRSKSILIAERIRQAVGMREFHDSRQGRIHLTVSIGIAGYPQDGQFVSDLLAKTEAGLKEATAKGGSKTSLAS